VRPDVDKATAVRNIAEVLTPDCVLFGGTVLGAARPHTRSARAFLWAANKQGGFDNLGDTADGLQAILDASLRDVEIKLSGSSALFSAAGPPRLTRSAVGRHSGSPGVNISPRCGSRRVVRGTVAGR
jgi:hypothetical protein